MDALQIIEKPDLDSKYLIISDEYPCVGEFKASVDKIDYNHCTKAYWQCPNKNCIMQLV